MVASKQQFTIEPERGETYRRTTFAVYSHSVYPRHSVLAGQPCRTYVDGGFTTIEDAQAKYPNAEVIHGSTHRSVASITAHLPGDDDVDPFGDHEPNDY